MGREMRQGPGGRKSHILQVVRIGRVHRQTKKSRNFQTDRKPHILGNNVQVADKERWGKSNVTCCLLHSWEWKKVKVKVTRSCLTLCDPMAYTTHGILQARRLEWVAIAFSRASFQPRDRTHVFCIAGRFFTTMNPQGSPQILLINHKTF